MHVFLIPLFLAFMNRVRGGLFQHPIKNFFPYYGTTVGRLVYGTAIGLSSLLLGAHYLLALTLIGTTLLGHAIAPFAPFQFMERSNDVFTMSLRGLILTGASAIAIMYFHTFLGGALYLALGALMGPVYKLGQILPIVPILNDDPTTRDKNDTSEVLYGLLTGFILVTIFLVR